MAEKEKQCIINDLLLLRSGLSYISVKSNEAKKELYVKQQLQKECNAVEMEIKSAQNKLQTSVKNHKEAQENLKELAAEKVKNPYGRKKMHNSMLSIFGYSILIGVITAIIVLILGAIIYGILKLFGQKDLAKTLDDYSILITMYSGVAAYGITFLILRLSRRNEKKQAKAEAKSNYENLEHKNKVVLSNELISTETLKSELVEKSQTLDNLKKKLEEQDKKIKMNVPILKKEVDIMYSYLKDTYKSLLNPMDWENLDLVIYYIETGRADSIKDALMQMDRQIQVNTIVSEIQKASSAIRSTIQNEMYSLKEGMLKCALALSEQISDLHNTIIKQNNTLIKQNNEILDSMESQTGIQNSQNCEIISQQELMISLQKKANAQSQELLNDYKYINSL